MSDDHDDDGATVLEKLVSATIVLLLLFVVVHAFDWGGKENDTVIHCEEASTFRRDWRTQMTYRWLVPKEENKIYLVFETLPNSIEVMLPIVGDREVDQRVHTCVSLEEAEAVIQVAQLESYLEVFEVAGNTRRIWRGEANTFRKHDLFVAAAGSHD